MPGHTDARNLHVLYVVPRYPTLSETFVAAEAEQVARLGPTVSVAAWHPPGPDTGRRVIGPVRPGAIDLVRCAVLVRRLGCSASPVDAVLTAVRAASLLRPVRASAPDLLHAHFASRPTHVAAVLSAALSVPMTAVFHARDYRVGLPRPALAARVAHAARVFAVSRSARAELVARVGDPVLASKIGVVRASWDVPGRYAAGVAGFDRTALRVVTVARLVPKKGLDLAIRAVARCRQDGLPVTYRVVGAGPEHAGLQRLAEQLGVADHVHLLGALQHSGALEELSGADIALMLCREAADGDADGIPVSLMEAAALGVPIVSTPVGGIAELVIDGRSGILVPPDDVPAAAAALTLLYDRPDLRRSLAAAAGATVRTEFAPVRQAELLVAEWTRATGGATVEGARTALR